MKALVFTKAEKKIAFVDVPKKEVANPDDVVGKALRLNFNKKNIFLGFKILLIKIL